MDWAATSGVSEAAKVQRKVLAGQQLCFRLFSVPGTMIHSDCIHSMLLQRFSCKELLVSESRMGGTGPKEGRKERERERGGVRGWLAPFVLSLSCKRSR